MTLSQATDACPHKGHWAPTSASWLSSSYSVGGCRWGLSSPLGPRSRASLWNWRSLMDQGSSEQSPEEPDAGGRTEPEVSRRASETEHGLSKITHNALENMGALGHGLKHFFQPQRRRSSVSPHDSVSSCSGAPPSEPTDTGYEVGDAPASSVLPSDSDNLSASAPPATLSRVLQQIRGAPPMMKRGTSLQSRRSKVGAPGDPPQKGSPQIHRRSTHEALLQSGRPRSSSTTDTPSSPALADMLLTSGYHSAEDPDKVSQSAQMRTQILHVLRYSLRCMKTLHCL